VTLVRGGVGHDLSKSSLTEGSPRRLIEVDLPISRISDQARREKSIRHGHISTLHIWWARRPLAACRAVVLAGLLPDPADESSPQTFRDAALRALEPLPGRMRPADDRLGLRQALLDFIADFSDWDRCADGTYLEAARGLVAAAYPAGPPTVVDPFAGGGSIPLEALRVGAEAWASDLNPVAVILEKVVLEYSPKYGDQLADGIRRWGARIGEQANARLGNFYPHDPDGRVPIAYLWARTALCEGPGCGASLPLIRGMWLSKKTARTAALKLHVRGLR
jgi:putative DNA methylase